MHATSFHARQRDDEESASTSKNAAAQQLAAQREIARACADIFRQLPAGHIHKAFFCSYAMISLACYTVSPSRRVFREDANTRYMTARDSTRDDFTPLAS